MNSYLRNAPTVTADRSHSTRSKVKIFTFCLASAVCAGAYGQASIQLPAGETVANTSVRSLAAAVSAAAKANPGEVELTVEKVSVVLGKGKKDFLKAAQSVPRQPAFTVATYSLLLLAAQKTYGAGRSADYLPLPQWRKRAKRASCLDMIQQLRREAALAPHKLIGFFPSEDFLADVCIHAAA